MTAEPLRCESKLHGVLKDDLLEVKCTSRWCGAARGVVVLHLFSTETGALVETRRYRDPKEGTGNAAQPDPAPVRAS